MTGTPIRHPVTQKIVYQQTPVRNQLINQTPSSAAQTVSRKLIQKSVKLLNIPRLKASDKVSTSTTQPVNIFPSNNTSNDTGSKSLSIPQLKAPIAPMPKLPAQQALLPQEKSFFINPELIPYKDKEAVAVFKAPELDDFLLSPVLGDQITDSTLMHRYLPKQADINRIMEQISRKYLTKLQLPCKLGICKLHT